MFNEIEQIFSGGFDLLVYGHINQQSNNNLNDDSETF